MHLPYLHLLLIHAGRMDRCGIVVELSDLRDSGYCIESGEGGVSRKNENKECYTGVSMELGGQNWPRKLEQDAEQREGRRDKPWPRHARQFTGRRVQNILDNQVSMMLYEGAVEKSKNVADACSWAG